MQKKSLGLLCVFVGLLMLVGVLAFNNFRRQQVSKKFVSSNVPTLFVHGWGSSYRAEQHMTTAAKRAGVTNTIIRADVDKSGAVKLVGKIPTGARNPIVEVNLADNKTPEGLEKPARVRQLYHQSAAYIKAVVLALQSKYHFKKINLVGHSMGNLLISYYILDNVKNKALPQLSHQVVIAGHYDGIKAMQPYSAKTKLAAKTGQPSLMTPEYRGLLHLRQVFPKTAKVLNIYGDIGNNAQSDGQVTVTSARSYRFLVKNAQMYETLKITGPQAAHSKLHENSEVDKRLISFLWENKK